MKISQFNSMAKGTPLLVSLGGCTYERVKFEKLVECQSLGKMTFADLMNPDYEFKYGRKHKEVFVIDSKGKRRLYKAGKLKLDYF